MFSIKSLLKLTSLLQALGLIYGCSFLGSVSAISSDAASRVVENHGYGDSPRQKMDIYLPENIDQAPLLMFIHGGAWSESNKNEYEFVAQRLVAEDIIVFVPNYRLAPDTVFPGFVKDAAQAVDEALSYSRETLNRAAPELILSGHSSGAHIAALLVLDEQYLADNHAHIHSWIGLSGPYRFKLEGSEKLTQIFGHWDPFIDTQPLLLAEQGAAENSPPALLVHGLVDDRVRPENSARMAKALSGSGVDAVLCEYDFGHARSVLSFATLVGVGSNVDEVVVDFIKGGPRGVDQPECTDRRES